MVQYALMLRATSISEMIRLSPWTWPLAETAHFIGMALLIGVVGLLDFHLLGFAKIMSMEQLRKLLPWGIFGFVINLVSGLIFVVGAPDQYASNPAFYFKLMFLALAGLNALYFETAHGKHVLELGHLDTPPNSLKIAGAVSLFSWFMVLYWGRMLPFIGNAF